jgi:hypothetical protein
MVVCWVRVQLVEATARKQVCGRAIPVLLMVTEGCGHPGGSNIVLQSMRQQTAWFSLPAHTRHHPHLLLSLSKHSCVLFRCRPASTTRLRLVRAATTRAAWPGLRASWACTTSSATSCSSRSGAHLRLLRPLLSDCCAAQHERCGTWCGCVRCMDASQQLLARTLCTCVYCMDASTTCICDCLRQAGASPTPPYIDCAVRVGCRCYLVQRQRAEQLGRSAPDFTKWVEDRRELGHLMHHLNLDT